jgi:hypothetical protein
LIDLIDRQFQRLAESVDDGKALDLQTPGADREERSVSDARRSTEGVAPIIEAVIDGGIHGRKFIRLTRTVEPLVIVERRQLNAGLLQE